MKSMLACLTACLFVAAAAAQAQTAIQPIKMQMVQPNVQIAQVKDPALEVARLERENKRLREENEALKKRVDDFTRLGGSEVHAYCPADNPTLSRNTAGAENDCGAAGYTCEPVSGQCRTSCQTSNMCAAGFTCDTGAQQCVRTG